MKSLTQILQASFKMAMLNPLGEMLYTLLLLLSAFTFVFFGAASVGYFFHVAAPESGDVPRNLLLAQYFQSRTRLATLTVLGLALVVCSFIPVLGVFLMPLLLIPMALSFHYELSVPVACKTMYCLARTAPELFLATYLLALLAVSGCFLLLIGVVLTFPIGMRALFLYYKAIAPELAASIQKAYS